MLCSGFPERLGHCIAYKPPGVFRVVFNSLKPLIDPKTAAKLIFVTGDVSDGSANDEQMQSMIGPHWKILTGAGQPVLRRGNTPGFHNDIYWPMAMRRAAQLRQRDQAALLQGNEDEAAANPRAAGAGAGADTPSTENCTTTTTDTNANNSSGNVTNDENDDDERESESGGIHNSEWQSNRPTCAGCGRRFGMVVRRHHCRRCGRCVCWHCSPHRLHPASMDSAFITENGSTSPVRRKASVDEMTKFSTTSSSSQAKVRVCRQCVAVLNSQQSGLSNSNSSSSGANNAPTSAGIGLETETVEMDSELDESRPASSAIQQSKANPALVVRHKRAISATETADVEIHSVDQISPAAKEVVAGSQSRSWLAASAVAILIFVYLFCIPASNLTARLAILCGLYFQMVRYFFIGQVRSDVMFFS